MCEWLSCREWCDVQLLCGGRALSAHRAVLASVSTFLRQILLSCPIEESPTFIVLPDFDLEAMSSVLYYIYNGEVVIQKHKLTMFLDIVKAMQIFIDNQYLPKLCNGSENTELYISKYKQNMLVTHKNNSLEADTCKVQRSVNIKKGERIQEIIQKSSAANDLNLRDKISCQDWSEHQKASLGNLVSPYGDRQRNSFLRDLFIETYPRNGNVNGRTAGVLAISNEPYLGAASMLLTNANGKQARADDLLFEASKAAHTSQLSSNFNPWQQKNCDQTFSEYSYANKLNCDQLNMKSFFESYKSSRIITGNPLMNYFPSGSTKAEKRLPIQLDLSTNSSKPQVLSSKSIISSLQNPTTDNLERNYEDYNKAETNITTNLAKSAILNQVLESPWCPRMPNNYRPFRRKCLNATNLPLLDMKAKEVDTANDGNNNVQTLKVSGDVDAAPQSISPNGTKEQTNTHCVSDFKCSVCDQVFATDGARAAHTRRHPPPAPARYSCGECSKSFSQLRNFKYHMSVHRGTREFAATCPVCGKYFNDRGYLSSHMKIHRNRKEYKCSQCPKSFNQRVAYNMHVRIHTGVKPHVCGECGKAFSRKMLLKQHQRTHSGERPYACPHCDKRFADRSNMTLHLRLHTGIKPFSCSLCPKSFTKKHHLKSHLNFHTGAKPYSCPRCKLAFTQSSNMRTHLKKCNAPTSTVNTDAKAPVDS